MTSLININSPLTFDATMMGAMEVYARAGQAVIISPFIVGGAMAPVHGGGHADPGAGRGARPASPTASWSHPGAR